jgi:hypothetical protein
MKRRNKSPIKQVTDSIEDYYATRSLKTLGMTDDQLSHCRFVPRHMDTRFGSWAFTWPLHLPSDIEQKAIPFLKPYLTYRWVTRDAPSNHHSIADAWEELAHPVAPIECYGTLRRSLDHNRIGPFLSSCRTE